jgi:hypothetical protein
MKPRFGIVTLFLLLSFYGMGQKNADIQVRTDETALAFPWAGGLNACQFGRMDLDGDGQKDLLVFDRHGNRLSCFLNRGGRGEINYVHAPEYAKHFPKLTDWAIFADYDGDGREDIFTYSQGWAGMKVYRNVSTEQIDFELVVYPYLTSWQGGGEVNIIATNADYPAIVDVDGDGDLDILTFGVLGTFIEKHLNLSMECYGTRDSLVFEKTDYCWGRVAESEENNEMYLDTCLFGKSLIVNEDGFRHRGATFAVRDLTGNSLPDLLLADVDYSGLTFLKNGGTPENALMVSQETHFPQNEPVRLFSMPVPFFTDINNDGVDDLLVSPFDPNPLACEGQNSVWLYLNYGTNQTPDFQLKTKSFLQNEMIDVGTGAYPVFADVDGDGLTDLLIGNIGDLDSTYYMYGSLQTHRSAQLAFYKNVGTKQNPVFQLIDNDFAGLKALKATGLAPTFGDLDSDERQEMIVGTSEGHLLFFDADFNFLDADFLHFEKAGLAPCLFDVDEDGVLDLMVGSADGKLAYYQGDKQGIETRFTLKNDFWGGVDVCDHTASYFGYSVPTLFRCGDEVLLSIGSEQGKVFLFSGIKNNLEGVFTDVSDRWNEYVCSFENRFGWRSASAMADLNDDGTLEMLVGNFAGGLVLLNGNIVVNQGVEEDSSESFRVFPNPAQGRVTIEGSGKLTIMNVLGQTVAIKEIHGSETVELLRGFWLVRLNHSVKKIVVE